MGLELNTSAYKRKKKSPGTNSGTYWQKIYTKVSATCKQTITLGCTVGGWALQERWLGEGTYQRMEGVSPFKVGRGRSLGGWSLPLT